MENHFRGMSTLVEERGVLLLLFKSLKASTMNEITVNIFTLIKCKALCFSISVFELALYPLIFHVPHINHICVGNPAMTGNAGLECGVFVMAAKTPAGVSVGKVHTHTAHTHTFTRYSHAVTILVHYI